jgi:hypothetical protein
MSAESQEENETVDKEKKLSEDQEKNSTGDQDSF